ncbi:MAG: SH3 domain-containing protein [Agathobacter sp.]|nr:SH3 domain-containing protein [Agathobacter sp.]
MKKKQVLPVLLVVGCILLVLLIVGAVKLIEKYTPTKEHLELTEYYNLSEASQVAITINNAISDSFATIINDHVYLDYAFVHDVLNERFYWDANENILLYTTASHVISAKAEASSYSVGKSSSDYGRPIVKATADSAWVDLEFVKKYSDFTYSFYESPSRLVITNDWKEISVSTLKGNTEVRLQGGIKSPILADVKKGDTLTVLETDKKWSKVCTADGIVGYVRSNKLKNATTLALTSDYEPETFHHIKKDKTINMLWHPVYSKAANSEITTILSTTKGVDVVSPTWFELRDNKGNISSLASTDYVTYAHDHGVEVWALVKNFALSNADVDTNYVLTHTSSRQNLVNQIVSQALQYNLDGINIDFESIKETELGDAYIQFLRELSIKCENNDIILSTAVAIPTSFNGVYKYSEQADFVDYICMMAYDQHWGQASGEGPVASLDWVEESVKNILAEDVPADQLVLGVPFYSKLWNLTPTSDEDAEEVSYIIGFKNYGLTSAKNWMNENISSPEWLDTAGQYYGETVKNGITYKMWLEDETSIEEKLKVMQEYKLAGAAFWSSDLDNTSIWEMIIKYIN